MVSLLFGHTCIAKCYCLGELLSSTVVSQYIKIIWPYCILLFQPVTRKICLRYLKLMSSLNMAICTRISYTLWVEWYYLKTNYLTLRSKVKVPWRSLWYVTHRLMVVHPHTKYNWPIWKDKKVMVWTSFAEKKQKRKKKSD